MFTKISYIKRKIRSLSLKVFNSIENNGNCNFIVNGEKLFIDNLFYYFIKSKQKRIVFDLGANKGEYSKIIQDTSEKNNIDVDLYLFEPTKSCFLTIKNKFEEGGVVLNNFGVSDVEGVSKIYYDKEQSGLASLYQRNLNSYNIKLDKVENIQLRRLDNYIKEVGIKHIDFIKIDIEGHELSAFKGFGQYLNADFISFIQFEYGGANLDSHTSLMELYELLEGCGFVICKIMPKGLDIRTYSPFMENFNYSNYVAISKKVIKNFL
ncbi:MAG: FkbM family methyltransferase [Methylomarinum sp.]|nr:FkbM family methyltransferase [Methylomarinum sp.]